MMKRVSKTRHKSRQAFTLVELIVVLIVLAILAAILIPALTGYVKRSRREVYCEEAHYALLAAQSVLVEYYGTGNVAVTGGDSASGGGGAKDIRWDKCSQLENSAKDREWGEKVLKLFDRTRENEPYYLIVGAGRPDENLANGQLYTVYYVAYVAKANTPAVFYMNGEWRYKYPTDDPEAIYKLQETSGGKTYYVNYLKVGKNRDKNKDIPLQLYVISNRSGLKDFWTNTNDPRQLKSHAEPYFKG